MRITTRFAPSPTGYLHLGHAFSALTAWQLARNAGGRFLLRLEDIDPTRCRPEYAAGILEDLAWLGLDWDGEVRVQSEHLPEYQGVLDTLSARGLLYPCFCTRSDIAREAQAAASAPHTPDGGPRYPGTCRSLTRQEREARLAAGIPFVLRLDMNAAHDLVGDDLTFDEIGRGTLRCDYRRFGDAVLARKDVPASYHLCVTHDDALQGVTVVSRGEDIRESTSLHRMIQALMGWPQPRYLHHALRTNDAGVRLAKRDGAATLRALRNQGITPSRVRSMAGVAV
jgi:glutamyl-Q tRNA(Asp) synthetase